MASAAGHGVRVDRCTPRVASTGPISRAHGRRRPWVLGKARSRSSPRRRARPRAVVVPSCNRLTLRHATRRDLLLVGRDRIGVRVIIRSCGHGPTASPGRGARPHHCAGSASHVWRRRVAPADKTGRPVCEDRPACPATGQGPQGELRAMGPVALGGRRHARTRTV